jgi:hypothetical protein
MLYLIIKIFNFIILLVIFINYDFIKLVNPNAFICFLHHVIFYLFLNNFIDISHNYHKRKDILL